MIIVRVTGGLGNQLFQYAAGYALSARLGVDLKLDLSAYTQEGMRQFQLDKFHTSIHPATKQETVPFTGLSLLQRAYYRLRPPYRRPVYKQPGFGYDPHFSQAGDGRYLKGYWQSWKFFEPVSGQLRNLYRLREEHTREVTAFAESLRRRETVSVHIRRGDYNNPEALAYHGLLSAAYYNAALQKIKTMHPGAEILFFSDDIEWVRAHVQTDLPHRFVTGILTRTALEDFHLMQHCMHHIIANSSFSWWAAWLNPHREKTVIAPQAWFSTTKNDTRDILPPAWIRL
jgi:hypothetical protein